jgi:hypothetical protein
MIAVELGFITQDVLDTALEKQQPPKLGAILLDMGVIDDFQLRELLFEQDVRRGKATDQQIIDFNREKKKRGLRELGQTFREAAESTARFVEKVSESPIKVSGE